MREGSNHQSNPVAPLTRLLESTLTVADIVSTPLWHVKPDMSGPDVLDAMTSHAFDIGGVGPEPIRRYVERSALRRHTGPVSKASKPIPVSLCVEKSLPVASLLTLLGEQERWFVLDGEQVRWVVTRADLAAPAVGVAVLSFLTVIEAGLQQLAQRLSDEEIARTLGRRKSAVDELFAKKLAQNTETSWRACLYFTDWLKVTEKTPEVLEVMGYSSAASWRTEVKSFPEVRNDLAHGRDLLTDGNPLRALKRVERIRTVTNAVWEAVRSQHPIWDTYASTVITQSGPPEKRLAGPGAVKTWRYPATCHVITAWNPGSVWMSEERNLKSNERLRESIVRHGGKAVEVVGSSPDRTWQEQSFLVTGLPRATVVDLANVYGQVAFFELTADRLHVVDSTTGKSAKSVRRIGA